MTNNKLYASSFVKRLKDNTPDYKEYELHDMLEIVSKTIRQLVLEGKSVVFPSLGTFHSKYKPSRPHKDPRTALPIMTKAKYVLEFKPTRELANSLKDINQEIKGCTNETT